MSAMGELIDWLPDGTPYSPRYGDRYRSELGGLAQSREVFLHGCGLPAAWAGQPQWCILETGFGLGLNFLVTWQAWKADSQRPRMLHVVATEAHPASAADVLRAASSHPELIPLAEQLQAQLWGLLPGLHRLVFEDGRLLLTLCIGDSAAVLRGQHLLADTVYLDGFSPAKNPGMWDMGAFKAVARCCRRGTRIASWTVARVVLDGLAQCGFVVQKTPGLPPKRDNLQGESGAGACAGTGGGAGRYGRRHPTLELGGDTEVPAQRRVMLVDALSDDRRYLRAKLAAEGLHDVDEASSGAEALALLGAQPYDLIVVDLQLRDTDSWALIRAIRKAQPALAHLFVTGKSFGWKQRVQAYFAGAEVCLVKPLDPGVLKKMIQKI